MGAVLWRYVGGAAEGGHEPHAISGRGIYLRWCDVCRNEYKKETILFYRIREAVKRSLSFTAFLVYIICL